MAKDQDDSGLFHASISLGRVAGVDVGLNWSWLLVFALVTLSLALTVFPDGTPGQSGAVYAGMAVVSATLFFACLLLHELGHAVQARREGMEMDGITLWVFGGVARFKGMFPSAGAELRIAIAGPLVSLGLGIAFVAISRLSLPAAVDGVATWLGTINFILLGFNMLPALPLDGGRVLRAAMWQRSGDFSKATRIAGALGRGFGQALIAFGVVLFIMGQPGGLWFALIGWFIAVAAAAEANLAEARVMLAGVTVGDAMVPDPVVVPAEATLEQCAREVFTYRRHSAYPVVDDGAAAGLLTFRAVTAVARERWPWTRVREVMTPRDEALVLDPAEPLFPATVELMQSASERALVARGDRLAGLLCLSDVPRLLELRRVQGEAVAPPHAPRGLPAPRARAR